MSNIATKLRTATALGLPNLLRVAAYRASFMSGFGRIRGLAFKQPFGPFFKALEPWSSTPRIRDAWVRNACYFGALRVPLSDAPPDWCANPFNGARVAGSDGPWWRIPDFDVEVGDIKAVWEASRFDWVLAFVQQGLAGDSAATGRLNEWLADWTRCNPPYDGPNWKCGQEASIRVIHLAVAALIAGQSESPLPGLLELIEAHLVRIEPTIGYAIGQDNNHGTSEAAALFIGGDWLAAHGRNRGDHWHRLGRKWLEDRAFRLVGEDGTFSQYSVNYHRLMLDTFSLVEVWRKKRGLPELSSAFRRRAAAATEWLRNIVDPASGDAPNIGANDGAQLAPLAASGYRDFRPAVQLASTLFCDRLAWAGKGNWNAPLEWLGVAPQTAVAPVAASRVFDDGGFAVLRHREAMAVMRYPRFRFRPGQADALHVDLWRHGQNLLRDAGTFGYNAGPELLEYFSGTKGHNTVQFDDRDQMPRLGRFLFGDWLTTTSVSPLEDSGRGVSFGAGYRDRRQAFHFRKVRLSEFGLQVEDRIDGFGRRAVLRWRLAPGSWQLAGRCVTDGRNTLAITSSIPIRRMELVEGWESRFYLQKNSVPVLEVEVNKPGTLATDFRWHR